MGKTHKDNNLFNSSPNNYHQKIQNQKKQQDLQKETLDSFSFQIGCFRTVELVIFGSQIVLTPILFLYSSCIQIAIQSCSVLCFRGFYLCNYYNPSKRQNKYKNNNTYCYYYNESRGGDSNYSYNNINYYDDFDSTTAYYNHRHYHRLSSYYGIPILAGMIAVDVVQLIATLSSLYFLYHQLIIFSSSSPTGRIVYNQENNLYKTLSTDAVAVGRKESNLNSSLFVRSANNSANIRAVDAAGVKSSISEEPKTKILGFIQFDDFAFLFAYSVLLFVSLISSVAQLVRFCLQKRNMKKNTSTLKKVYNNGNSGRFLKKNNGCVAGEDSNRWCDRSIIERDSNNSRGYFNYHNSERPVSFSSLADQRENKKGSCVALLLSKAAHTAKALFASTTATTTPHKQQAGETLSPGHLNITIKSKENEKAESTAAVVDMEQKQLFTSQSALLFQLEKRRAIWTQLSNNFDYNSESETPADIENSQGSILCCRSSDQFTFKTGNEEIKKTGTCKKKEKSKTGSDKSTDQWVMVQSSSNQEKFEILSDLSPIVIKENQNLGVTFNKNDSYYSFQSSANFDSTAARVINSSRNNENYNNDNNSSKVVIRGIYETKNYSYYNDHRNVIPPMGFHPSEHKFGNTLQNTSILSSVISTQPSLTITETGKETVVITESAATAASLGKLVPTPPTPAAGSETATAPKTISATITVSEAVQGAVINSTTKPEIVAGSATTSAIAPATATVSVIAPCIVNGLREAPEKVADSSPTVVAVAIKTGSATIPSMAKGDTTEPTTVTDLPTIVAIATEIATSTAPASLKNLTTAQAVAAETGPEELRGSPATQIAVTVAAETQSLIFSQSSENFRKQNRNYSVPTESADCIPTKQNLTTNDKRSAFGEIAIKSYSSPRNKIYHRQLHNKTSNSSRSSKHKLCPDNQIDKDDQSGLEVYNKQEWEEKTVEGRDTCESSRSTPGIDKVLWSKSMGFKMLGLENMEEQICNSSFLSFNKSPSFPGTTLTAADAVLTPIPIQVKETIKTESLLMNLPTAAEDEKIEIEFLDFPDNRSRIRRIMESNNQNYNKDGNLNNDDKKSNLYYSCHHYQQSINDNKAANGNNRANSNFTHYDDNDPYRSVISQHNDYSEDEWVEELDTSYQSQFVSNIKSTNTKHPKIHHSQTCQQRLFCIGNSNEYKNTSDSNNDHSYSYANNDDGNLSKLKRKIQIKKKKKFLFCSLQKHRQKILRLTSINKNQKEIKWVKEKLRLLLLLNNNRLFINKNRKNNSIKSSSFLLNSFV